MVTVAYVDQYALAVDAVFRQKVQVAVTIAARDVQGEPIGSRTATHQAKRQQLARSIILSPTQYTERFAWMVAANPSVNPAVDSDIQFTVNSVFDDVAGVDDTDTP